MRIGVDIRGLTVPIFGIGRYTKCLLDQLVKVPNISWYLYADRPVVHPIETGSILQRQFRSPNRVLSLYRTQYEFSKWARLDDLDLFWSPRHHLPLRLDARIKKVVTIHDMVWAKFPDTMMLANRLLEQQLMPRSIDAADHIIAVSESTRNDLIELIPGCEDKVSVIYEAVCDAVDEARDEGKTRRIESLGKLQAQPYFLFVGTLEPRKNLNNLLLAYEKYQSLGGTNQLIIVGGKGWKQKNLSIKRYHGAVKLEGYVTDEKLMALYSGAEALLLPSLYEGFGLPALEAMQFGVPVIGSNRAAIPEVVGAGGILVDPLCIGDITKAMLRLTGDKSLRSKLGREALDQSKKFSWSTAAEETMKVFNQVLSN